MAQMKMLITPGGKHPARKWAELAADEIVEISAKAPATLVREARDFRDKLITELTTHHQAMMDHEGTEIEAGRHDLAAQYETEDYAKEVATDICDKLAAGTSFADHFQQDNVRTWIEGICNKYFKSAKMVERQHFHSEKGAAETGTAAENGTNDASVVESAKIKDKAVAEVETSDDTDKTGVSPEKPASPINKKKKS